MKDHTANDFRAKSYDVFISYKNLDADVRDILVEALEVAGLSVWWDAKLVSGAFRPQLAGRINNCKLVVALWSAQVGANPVEVFDEMSQARGLDRLMVLRTDGAEIPKLFGEQNFMPFDGWADPTRRKAQLEIIIAEVRRRVAAPTYQVVEPGKHAVSTLVEPSEFGDIPGAPDNLIGRDIELAMLRDAWTSQPPRKVNAVVLHALGGAGKSALLRTFANELLAAGGGGAARIYGWSAYSQGSGEQKRADADGFISKALADFNFDGSLPSDSVERARALAKLIQKERVLLLLDGLEPLQDPPSLNKGRFKDKGLAELIKLLAAQNAGVVVLTTRQEVPELGGYGPLVINHALEELSSPAGADLLVELGVRGRQRDLEAAVREVEGHALSVTLLGTYLAEVCGGDIRHRDQFDFAGIVLSPGEKSDLLTDKTIIPAKRAAKVMRGYLEQFAKLATDPKRRAEGLGGPERALLDLLGLFDRPADGPAVDALLAQHIPELSDELFFETIVIRSGFFGFWRKVDVRELTPGQRSARLREAKNRLRKLRLLSNSSKDDPRGLDAHPLVRAFFAGHIEETAPEAAKTAHEILCRHYSAATPDLPDTLTEMQPLFHAVRHGVRAGRVQEACDEIFWRRIRRGRDLYITRVLGAFGAQLATCVHFFEKPWDKPHPLLNSDDVPWLLGDVAFALGALGRLREAITPNRAALASRIARHEWRNAATDGGILSNVLLTLGRVLEAVEVAELAVKHADLNYEHDQSDRADLQRELRRGTMAIALAAAGNMTRASELFGDAEAIRERRERYRYGSGSELPSLPGYHYGDLLLAQGDAAEALRRGRYQLRFAEMYLGRGLGLHDIGLGKLLIGRAEEALGGSDAGPMLDAAVDGLRQSGRDDHVPKALLARAAHWRRGAAAGETKLMDPIRADLAEVEDIAGDEMRLYLTDLALERARLAIEVPLAFASAEAARGEAWAQTEKAADLIRETGYHRRDQELAELKAQLATKLTDVAKSGQEAIKPDVLREPRARDTGTVKDFHIGKGGFITPDRGGEDVVVDWNAVVRAKIGPLEDGMRVSFELESDERGRVLKAVKLRPAD
jgi:cold shock CspA family protein